MIENQNGEDRIAKAIQELQEERVASEPKTRLVAKMAQPRRRTRATRWALCGATASLAVGAILLWPQQKAFGWDKVVQATLAQKDFHSVSYKRSADGKSWEPLMEEWVDGDKYALRMSIPEDSRRWFHSDYRDIRRDGKRFYYYPSGGGGTGPATGVVTDFKEKSNRPMFWKFSVDELLKSKWLKFEGEPEKTQVNGVDVLKYRAQRVGREKGSVVFYANAGTGVLVRTEWLNASGEVTGYEVVDTPDSIPASQFEPPTSGVLVIDGDKERKIIHEAMSHGVPFGHGNVLRIALGGDSKYLTLAWTGTPPNSDGTPHAKVVGAKIVHFGTSENFVLLPDGRPAMHTKFEGDPVYVLNFTLDRPLGKEVTLDLPVLVPDKSKPIRDRSGAIAGYHSVQVGTKRLSNIRLVQSQMGLAAGW